MLAAAGDVQPPRVAPGRAPEELGRELLRDPQLPLPALPARLPALVVPPHEDRALRRQAHGPGVPKHAVDVHGSSIPPPPTRPRAARSQDPPNRHAPARARVTSTGNRGNWKGGRRSGAGDRSGGRRDRGEEMGGRRVPGSRRRIGGRWRR